METVVIKNHNKRIPSKGFTLVETLVAISILLVAVVTPITLISQNITNANVAKDTLTASYLAQEGIELIRGMRDTHVLKGASAPDWLSIQPSSIGSLSDDNLVPCIYNSALGEAKKYCMVNGHSGPSAPQSYVACANPVDFDSCTYLPVVILNRGLLNEEREYGFNTGQTETPSIFKRAVSIDYNPNLTDTAGNPLRYALVESTVQWKTNTVPRSITYRTYLYNWAL